MQMTSSLGVELSNIGVIVAANDTISIVFNFIAVAIIAEFDNYVFDSMKNENFKRLIEERFSKPALVICHTTSKKCKLSEVSSQKDEKTQRFRPMKITFESRNFVNKILFFTYKLLRTFYVSFFYYFLPFLCVIVSTIVPTYFRGN